MKSLSISAALLAVVLAAGDARAEAVEPVRVYTNADIERLPPLPTQPAPLVDFDRERWEFVIQFLEREHALLNADRNQDLARELLRAEIAVHARHQGDRAARRATN